MPNDYRNANAIQVVDFGPFVNESSSTEQKQNVANDILQSFQQIGFVYLINHGLDQNKISGMFDWSRKLFDLPLAIKELVPRPLSAAHHRGYSALGREKLKLLSESSPDSDEVAAKKASGQNESNQSLVINDMKESFDCGREDDDEMPNIWFPDGVFPGFKEACLDFYWACYETEKLILKALAIGHNLPDDYFTLYHSNAKNQLRLLHYPSIQVSALQDEKASRTHSHTDFCSFTMLMQDSIGGLEVEDPNHPGTFMPVPPVPGSIVVNAGDFLMRWSNNTIKSTLHRVRIPPSLMEKSSSHSEIIPQRYSIPYFCSADRSTIIDCIPGTWSEERPKLYSPISAREYVMKRFEAIYM